MNISLNPNYRINFNEATYGSIRKDEIDNFILETIENLVKEKHDAGLPYNIVLVQDEASSSLRPFDAEEFDNWNARSDKNPVTNAKIKYIYHFAIKPNSNSFEPLNPANFPQKIIGNNNHEIDVSISFAPLRVFTVINLDEIEYFNKISIANLINNKEFFALAVAQNKFSLNFSCFDALKLLQGKDIIINPATKEKIGFIFFYACKRNEQNQIIFDLIGHSKEADGKKKSFRECYLNAIQGNLKAQVKLGNYYKQGDGTEVDFEKAYSWYSKTANLKPNNSTEAHHILKAKLNKGICLLNGEGVKKDVLKAKRLFEALRDHNPKSIIQRQVELQLGLCLYEQGEYSLATSIFRNFYDKNNKDTEAQFYLAKSLTNPNSKNIEEGIFLFLQLANENHREAFYELGLCYLHVAKNQVKAFRCFEASTKLGFSKAKINLSLCYLEGRGVGKDLQKAKQMFNLEELKKDPVFHNMIGGRLFRGMELEQDYESAFKHFNISANLGYPEGIRNTATCYFNGTGVEKDVQKALDLLKSLAIKGDLEAQFRLGSVYLAGEKVEIDIKEGLKWLNSSATLDHAGAQLKLGMYYFGKNNMASHQIALSWFSRCAKQENAKENASAKYHLDILKKKL